MKSPASVVQEYDRKKKLAGDLGNGFVRFNLSPAKVHIWASAHSETKGVLFLSFFHGDYANYSFVSRRCSFYPHTLMLVKWGEIDGL